METTQMLDLTGVDLTIIMDQILAIVPVVLPVVIAFIGLRKGLAFLKSSLKGA